MFHWTLTLLCSSAFHSGKNFHAKGKRSFSSVFAYWFLWHITLYYNAKLIFHHNQKKGSPSRWLFLPSSSDYIRIYPLGMSSPQIQPLTCHPGYHYFDWERRKHCGTQEKKLKYLWQFVWWVSTSHRRKNIHKKYLIFLLHIQYPNMSIEHGEKAYLWVFGSWNSIQI